jgi:hypothetical protein
VTHLFPYWCHNNKHFGNCQSVCLCTDGSAPECALGRPSHGQLTRPARSQISLPVLGSYKAGHTFISCAECLSLLRVGKAVAKLRSAAAEMPRVVLQGFISLKHSPPRGA